MAFNQNSFANFSNNDIVGFINNINQGLNENLDIANTRQYRGGARLRNAITLSNNIHTMITKKNVREEGWGL